MNVELIKNGITKSFGRGSLYLQKYSPQILLGAGIVGGVVAAVMAAKATLKVEEIVSDHNLLMHDISDVESSETLSGQGYTHEDAVKDRGIVYVRTGLKFAKLYGPSVGLGVLSISAILAAHGIMAKRQTALAATVALISEAYQTYRDRVVEELGEEKDRQFHLGLREEKVLDEDYDDADGAIKFERKVLVSSDPNRRAPSIYARFFDSSNTQWTSDRLLNRAFLTAQQNYINDLLIIRGHVFLNEVYERLGFPHTKEGSIVGWVLRNPEQMKQEGRDGYISFGLENPIYVADREFMNLTNDSILLDFNVDGLIFDKI